MRLVASNKMFSGWQNQYEHESDCLSCTMQFSVYLPPAAENQDVPVLYWLSGLTCTDQNFVTKAGAQRVAAELGMAIVCPDTSPRGEGVPDDPEGGWDFGLGAGFYLNATQAPYQTNYQMYDYIVSELFELVGSELPINNKLASISGHSMGGHGALTIALKNDQQYHSVSAFAPIAAPTQCGWGEKAFTNYLGSNRDAWQQYDASLLLKHAEKKLPMLIDQGLEDDFLTEQLKPLIFLEFADLASYPMEYREQAGYDHSFFFIASFIEDHLRFHSRVLKHA
jgi:S-formylglutathione hydrolase